MNILCSNRENFCSCFWKYFLCWRLFGCFWEYFMFFKERVTASEEEMCSCFWTYFLCRRKCAAASENISCFLRNVWLLLKRKRASENYVHLRNVLKWKQLEIKMMLIYFSLNYCDENHVERIPIVVKNINHLFHLASEIIETSSVFTFWRHSNWW